MLNHELFLKSFHYICESLIVNPGLYSELNLIYQKNKFAYYKKAKENSLFEDSYITNGSLEREIRIKQVMGMVLNAEEDELLRTTLLNKISKYYPDIFELVKKKSPELIVNIFTRKQNADWMQNNSYSRIAFYLIRLKYGFEAENIQAFSKLIDFIERSFNNFNEWKPLTRLDDERYVNPTFMPFIKKYENLLGNYKRCKDFSLLMDRSDGINKSESFAHSSNLTFEIQKDILTKIRFMTSLFDIQDLSNTLLTNPISLTKVELRQIFTAIILTCQKKIEQVNSLSENQIIQYYIFGIYFQSLLKEYKNAKELYRKNNQETQFLELERLSEVNKLQKEENLVLENKLQKYIIDFEIIKNNNNKIKTETEKEFYAQIKQLEIENEKLRSERKSTESNLVELHRLREFAFSLESEDTLNDSDSEEIIFPKDKNIFLVGGHENWRKKVKDNYPLLTIVDGTNQNIDPDIFRNADLVLFFTPHMNHATYSKFIGYLNKNRVNYGYISQHNIKLFEHQLLSELNRI